MTPKAIDYSTEEGSVFCEKHAEVSEVTPEILVDSCKEVSLSGVPHYFLLIR